MISIIDWLLDTLLSGLAQNRLSKTEQVALDPGLEQISLCGHNGSIRWKPVPEGTKPCVVLEKEVWGSSVKAVEGYLDLLKLEHRISGSRSFFSVTRPPRPGGIRSVRENLILYASPEQIRGFQAQTKNGKIDIETQFSCDLDLRSRNGHIVLRSGRGALQISTSNGRIELGRVQLANSSTFSTSNGRIDGNVTFPSQGEFSFQTSNGSINLRLPQDTRGSFDLGTSNGAIDFKLGEKQITGRNPISISRGIGPLIRAKTSNGSICLLEETLT